MDTLTEFEILEFLERPENSHLKELFNSIKEYHTYYGLEPVISLIELLERLKIWVIDIHKTPIISKAVETIMADMISCGYNDIVQFVITDILILNIGKAFDSFYDPNVKYLEIAFQKEQYAISRKLRDYSVEEVYSIINGSKDKPPKTQRDILFVYLLECNRGAVEGGLKSNFFVELITARIKELKVPVDATKQKSRAEIFLEEIKDPTGELRARAKYGVPVATTRDNSSDEPQETKQNKKQSEFSEKTRLFVKDIAEMLSVHESQVRRLMLIKHNPLPYYRDTPNGRIYFFFAEIMDWLKSNKQQSTMEEAGDIFKKRKSKRGKKHRPKLE